MADRMASISFTDEQLRAIRTTGQSVIVTAAAGSGKTAVLAQRCAYLVCDAPPDQRCSVDELLVLTFTDAAAAEMRSRIVEAIRARTHERPHDDRLREQAALVDSAQICTIHSFCLWVVRRWFSHVAVDPVATVMDDDETALLKADVLDALFAELYRAIPGAAEEPLGSVSASSGALIDSTESVSPSGSAAGWHRQVPGRAHEALPAAFRRLVDDYGLGDDRETAAFVLRLHDFLTSLPTPEAWVDEACAALSDHPEEVIQTRISALVTELDQQIEHSELAAEAIESGLPAGHRFAVPIRGYVNQLRAWSIVLKGAGPPGADKGSATEPCPRDNDLEARFDIVREELEAFKFERVRSVRGSQKVSEDDEAAGAFAKAQLERIRGGLFAGRLKKGFGLFTAAEWRDGLRRTAPYVATIAEVTSAFTDAYTRRKRAMGVMDFADLERLAFEVLSQDGDPARPSEPARSLHQRFTHVLVDEFQDVNPIQRAIIELVSREADPSRSNNLFVVGDIKQSIYRFRLAEPSLFIQRLERFSADQAGGAALVLQTNFRSRPEILDTVNAVFRQLMRPGCADVVYGEEAELRPGRVEAGDAPRHPAELHVLERRWLEQDTGDGDLESAPEADPERGASDPYDPARWTPIEREAYLIGSRIRELTTSDVQDSKMEPPAYRDIAVLLRAARVNAEHTALMLGAMGIPAHADVGGSLFAAREIRDVTAALELLDNAQQDMPLAAVMRSGIFGETFSANDLVEIRCLSRDIPFHAAAREYVSRGQRDALRHRLQILLSRVERFRERVRLRPLADVLWELLRDQGFLASAGGLPGGAQRRANLLKLHEWSRQFGVFRRQGLHRFLQFIGHLDDEQRAVAAASAITEADNVVRVMSIHQAKGLEFPIVFLAGLGNKFNLGDRTGRMIFERQAHIGLRAVDTTLMLEYPSAAHAQVADEIERTALEEELRILYVGMTRARDRLIMVGSQRDIASHPALTQLTRAGEPARSARSPSRLSVRTARTPLDWLLPALAAPPVGPGGSPGEGRDVHPATTVQLHEAGEMAAWKVARDSDTRNEATRQAAARLQPLPDHEPVAPDDPLVEQTLARLAYTYPAAVSASTGATLAASDFKGLLEFRQGPEQRTKGTSPGDFQFPPTKYGPAAGDRATHRGLVTHRVLQHLDFRAASRPDGVASELHRLVDEGLIAPEDAQAVDRNSMEWFVRTPLAEAIRQAGDGYRRELPYITAEALASIDPSAPESLGDYVLVRGIVDGIVLGQDGLEVVDFKTDAIRREDVAARANRYRSQVLLYARAVSRLWRRPVRRSWLVFLSPATFVVWDDPADASAPYRVV
jgi:ATP-dependent helicase/nuclease subunit A